MVHIAVAIQDQQVCRYKGAAKVNHNRRKAPTLIMFFPFRRNIIGGKRCVIFMDILNLA
jgi:hypothetical protein